MEHERDLARRAAAGDAAAFTALVRLHEGDVRRFLARLLRGDGADDLAQAVFLKAWRMAAAWRGEGSYKAWLMGIAWTSFLSFHRARRREQVQADPPSSHAGDPDLAIDVARALDSLDARERAAALLCFGEGYSHAEAAAIMQIPLGTLKSVVARARAGLIARLEAKHD